MFCHSLILIQHDLYCARNNRKSQVSGIAVNTALHLCPTIHFMFCAVRRKLLFSHLFSTDTGGPEQSVVLPHASDYSRKHLVLS